MIEHMLHSKRGTRPYAETSKVWKDSASENKGFLWEGFGETLWCQFPLLAPPLLTQGCSWGWKLLLSSVHSERGFTGTPWWASCVCLENGERRDLVIDMNLRKLAQLLSASRPSGHCTPLWWRVRGVPGAMTHVTFGRKRQPWVFCKEILTKREGPWTNGFLVRGSGDWSWGCQGQPCEGQLLPIITGVAVCKTQQGNLGSTHQSTCERKSQLQASARSGG